MFYYKTYFVPYWVIVDDVKKQQEIVDWFKKADAKLQPWPSTGFKESVEGFKNKGWRYVWEESKSKGFEAILPPQLVALAISHHVKTNFSPFTELDMSMVHRLDRKIRNDSDYDRIINEVIKYQDSIRLSQLFRVAEICHDENKSNRPQVWISVLPCDRDTIVKITSNLITIGNNSSDTINVRSVKSEDIPEFLAKKMLDLYN